MDRVVAEPVPSGQSFAVVRAYSLLDAVAERFAARLSRRLVGIAARTLVHEHNRKRTPGLAELVATYPVLARLLGEACLLAVESTVELLGRFAADRTAIVDSLLDGVDPGRVVSVETGLGDAHRRGRAVAILTFADGSLVVYKPRDLVAHQRFGDLVGWLNRQAPGIGLRTPDVLLRQATAGWSSSTAAG